MNFGDLIYKSGRTKITVSNSLTPTRNQDPQKRNQPSNPLPAPPIVALSSGTLPPPPINDDILKLLSPIPLPPLIELVLVLPIPKFPKAPKFKEILLLLSWRPV